MGHKTQCSRKSNQNGDAIRCLDKGTRVPPRADKGTKIVFFFNVKYLGITLDKKLNCRLNVELSQIRDRKSVNRSSHFTKVVVTDDINIVVRSKQSAKEAS